MRTLSILIFVTACGEASPPPIATSKPDGPCDLVAAMLSIDNVHYQDFYAGRSCGERIDPLVVEVLAPSLIPAGTRCVGHRFQLYQGEPIDRVILRLAVVPDGERWQFVATRFQPTPRDVPSGGFVVADSYCYVKGGFVELHDGRWRTFYDLERALHAGE